MGNLISVTGTAVLESVDNKNGGLYNQSFELSLQIANVSGSVVKITADKILLTSSGGYIDHFFRNRVFGPIGPMAGHAKTLAPGATLSGSKKYQYGMGFTHLLVRVQATSDSGQTQEVLAAVPINRPGFAPVPALDVSTPVTIGLWTRPVELYPTTVGGQVQLNNATDPWKFVRSSWLTLAGQIINFSGSAMTLTKWNAKVVVNGKTVHESALPMTFRTYDSGDKWVSLPGDPGSQSHLGDFNYFADGFYLGDLGPPFANAHVAITAGYEIDGHPGQIVREVPIVWTVPARLPPPVKGLWKWGNCANHNGFDVHAWFHQRFSVDVAKVNDTHHTMPPFANPEKNESYFAYGQPVRAMADGVVLAVESSFPENFGNKRNTANDGANYVVLGHDGGEQRVSGYYHLQHGVKKVTEGQMVKAGDVIGLVGNTGQASGPHLHFACAVLDATGRGTICPMEFTGLRAQTQLWPSPSKDTLRGVPTNNAYLSDPDE